jgi:hypothetical protein
MSINIILHPLCALLLKKPIVEQSTNIVVKRYMTRWRVTGPEAGQGASRTLGTGLVAAGLTATDEGRWRMVLNPY